MKSDAGTSSRATGRGTGTMARGVLPRMPSPTIARHSRHAVVLVGLAVVVLAVTACANEAGVSGPAGSQRPTRSDVPAEPVPSSSGPAMTGEVPGAIIAAILDDAAARSGLPVDDLAVTRAEAMTFSDGSLDCPEPGMAYTQALVDGYQVEVEAADETLDYRVGTGGAFRLCESGGPPAGG
jgi:hypothetical protein